MPYISSPAGIPDNQPDALFGGGDMDPNFLAEVQIALASNSALGDKYYSLSQDQVLQWAQELWNSPNMRQSWANAPNSSGSYALFNQDVVYELTNAGGRSDDPNLVVDFLTAKQNLGETLSKQEIYALNNAGAALTGGSGGSIATAEEIALGITNRPQETVYAPVVSQWKQYFGKDPTTAQLNDIIAHGSDLQSWTDYIRSLPSHIGGMNAGQAFDLRQLADSVSQSIYGHNATDSIVQSLFQTNNTNQAGVKYFYDQMQFQPGTHVDPRIYNSAVAANQPTMKGVFSETGMDPRVIKSQLDQAGVNYQPQGDPKEQTAAVATGHQQ